MSSKNFISPSYAIWENLQYRNGGKSLDTVIRMGYEEPYYNIRFHDAEQSMKSLLKAIDTINAVAEAGSAGIRELSAITGYPPSTIHRIAAALVKRHYFQQDPVTKQYELSFRFLELGTRVQQKIHLTSIARPHIERLMDETRESVNLAVRDADSIVYLDNAQSNHSMLQLFTRPGARVPLYATGVGKLFLSAMQESELDAYLERIESLPLYPVYTGRKE